MTTLSSAVEPMPDDADAATSLCTACGMCCNGLLYPFAHLSDRDEARIERHALPVIRNANAAVFRQPCTFHRGNRCTVYEDRFSVCAGYECALLNGVQTGRIPLAAARGVLRQVLELVEELRGNLGLDASQESIAPALNERIRSLGNDGAALSPGDARFALRVRVLWLLFHRHFDGRVHPRLHPGENDRPAMTGAKATA
jgi:uncharacterized protein